MVMIIPRKKFCWSSSMTAKVGGIFQEKAIKKYPLSSSDDRAEKFQIYLRINKYKYLYLF